MRKNRLQEMQKIAEAHGGKCLSTTYVNNYRKLRWQCKEGHEWEAVPLNIKQSHWCPVCAHARALAGSLAYSSRKNIPERNIKEAPTIQQMRKIAADRGGECLSPRYSSSQEKLTWQCTEGHQWEATSSNIKRHWCPACAIIKRTKNTIEQFQNIAEARGGKCLSKKYTNPRTKLRWQCKESHQWEAFPYDIKSGTWCPACAGLKKKTLEEIQTMANVHGVKCLSSTYLNRRSKLTWQCSKGHQWEARPDSIQEGYGCPLCHTKQSTIEKMHKIAQERDGNCLSKTNTSHRSFLIPERNIKEPNTIQRMRKIAADRGGECLSPRYRGAREKLTWQCKEGHQWDAIPYGIKQGRWCPACYGNKKSTIEEMHKLAEQRGGKCLSTTYLNDRSKLTWECRKGHQWEANPNTVKNGTWCTACAGNKKGTIEEMQQIASARGGKCLSTQYINSYSKLIWQCSADHQWQAVPNSIKKGSWCPVCAWSTGATK